MFHYDIFRTNSKLNLKGSFVERISVRAIIPIKNQLLMVYSEVEKDFKFPGGTVELGETLEEALFREVIEEAGVTITSYKLIGTINEYNTHISEDYYLTKSFCYLCSVQDFSIRNLQLTLDRKEKELGFRPVLISIEEALLHNKLFISQYPWIKREIKLLEHMLKK